MSLASLITHIDREKGRSATAATARNGTHVSAKPAPVLACTSATSATAQNDNAEKLYPITTEGGSE